MTGRPSSRLAIFLLLVVLLGGCSPNTTPVDFLVISHPDGKLYVGDLVSFEVLASDDKLNQAVTVSFKTRELGSTTFTPYGIGGRVQATFWWVWDTAGLEPGKYYLVFSLADGYSWEYQVRLYPVSRLPGPEPDSSWESVLTDCCTIHYITGTDAARDLPDLVAVADQESAEVAEQLGTILQQRIDLIFMPRVIGHGGFAWNGVYISYLDDNYVGSQLDMVLHHEFVHYFDSWVGGEYLPTILREGLAVYYSGGHFKPEPIPQRAAALVDLGWYIPLQTLADDFYNQQHDIGYLEAAAFVQYLQETYGPGAFTEFYRTITYLEGMTDSQILDAALPQDQLPSFVEMEAGFLGYLGGQTGTEAVRRDLEITVADYDLIRRYQSLFDPSAYFLTAWLPDGLQMIERGILADLTRHPAAWQNMLLEGMIRHTNKLLFSGKYDSAEREITWINRLLDILDK